MKKVLSVVIVFFVTSVVSVMANPFKFNWDFGTFFFGGYSEYKNNSIDGSLELNVQILDFRFETENGFSISASPFNCFFPLNNKETDDVLLSLVNCTLAYDIFEFKRNIQLMPFASFHLGLEGLQKSWADCGIVFNTFAHSADSQEQNLLDYCNIDFNIFTVKAGARFIQLQQLQQLQPQIYLDVGINILLFTLLFFGNSGNSD